MYLIKGLYEKEIFCGFFVLNYLKAENSSVNSVHF